MRELKKLIERIIDRVNVNLREPPFDVGPYIHNLVPLGQFTRFYAFYGLTADHPLHFHFVNSTLAGSYFLGKCTVDHSVLYKSDIRGDELKTAESVFHHQGLKIPLHDDEEILIKDSYLVKTLVHNYSHDPESPEEFFIQNTVSLQYANIHGSPVEGCFLGPSCTVDLTTLHDCVIGPYAYVQVGELAHRFVEPGQVWISGGGLFEFRYRFSSKVLDRYIEVKTGSVPCGIFMDFVEERKEDFQQVFSATQSKPPIPVPPGASLSRFAVVKGNSQIGENVLVAQRSYLEDALLGKGSSAQENCYIIRSRLEGYDVTAHGGKIVDAKLGERVFVGFNAFLRGGSDRILEVGEGCIILPHTIIDLEEAVQIPARRLVWGHIRTRRDLEANSLDLKELMRVDGEIKKGSMRFRGSGAQFASRFLGRIEHILEANGAFFDGRKGRGHAQREQHISFNIIQPYQEGNRKGLYPTIDIRP
jgi:carbonic anhydrase/acetyltransferase-like protein (isoleucine patch superfamily)